MTLYCSCLQGRLPCVKFSGKSFSVKQLILFILWVPGPLFPGCFGQTGVPFEVAPGLHLPKDPEVRVRLLESMQGWLESSKGPDSLNGYIDPSDLAGVSLLTDELRGLQRSSSDACKCYLTNVLETDSLHYLVQFSFLSERLDTPVVMASFTMHFRQNAGKWIASSILRDNTIGWKQLTIANCLFHFKTAINERDAAAFVNTIASYDKRLHAKAATIDFYCCDNLLDAARLIGEDYRADYNGLAFDELSTDYARATIVVSGGEVVDHFNKWDPHDWWHGRLHRVVSTAVINRPVDEGMAYLYGGSWQVYTWADILAKMKAYAGLHPDADWLTLYKESAALVPRPKDLIIPYVINALIVRRVENERGFSATLPLLCCGKREQGDANYFAALKQLTGVTEEGFNAYVRSLIRD